MKSRSQYDEFLVNLETLEEIADQMKNQICRGVGTGETSEARASPEIRGCLKSNRQEKKYVFWVLHLKLHCSYAPVYHTYISFSKDQFVKKSKSDFPLRFLRGK